MTRGQWTLFLKAFLVLMKLLSLSQFYAPMIQIVSCFCVFSMLWNVASALDEISRRSCAFYREHRLPKCALLAAMLLFHSYFCTHNINQASNRGSRPACSLRRCFVRPTIRDVVLTKKVWKRSQKTTDFKTASNSLWNKTWKKCGNAVPTRSRPTTPLSADAFGEFSNN